MYYRITGSGNPIVFIHGFCETHTIWRAFEEALSKTHQVILVDLPGFGESDLPESDFSLRDIANQLKTLLDTLKIEKCFMIGHSLGGYICLEFAKKYEEQLLGFGFFNSTIFADNKEKKYIRDKTIQFVGKHGTKAFTNTFVSNLFYEGNRLKFSKEIMELTKSAAATNPETIIAYSKAMKTRHCSLDFWKQCQKPVFLIAGAKDEGIPIEDSTKIIDAISNGKGIILPETGHMGFVEKEKEALKFIKVFFVDYLN
jgi:pimeloyl-ACP methyl ester carboxylesterase